MLRTDDVVIVVVVCVVLYFRDVVYFPFPLVPSHPWVFFCLFGFRFPVFQCEKIGSFEGLTIFVSLSREFSSFFSVIILFIDFFFISTNFCYVFYEFSTKKKSTLCFLLLNDFFLRISKYLGDLLLANAVRIFAPRCASRWEQE